MPALAMPRPTVRRKLISALALACAFGAAAAAPPDAAADGAGAPTIGTTPSDGTVVIELTLDGRTARTISVTRGQRVRLQLRTPRPMELHLHGYDLTARADATAPAVFVFEARHAGRFAIVAHGDTDLLGRHEVPLAYLEVRPE